MLRNERNYHGLPLRKWLISRYDIYPDEFFSHYRRRLYILFVISRSGTHERSSHHYFDYIADKDRYEFYSRSENYLLCAKDFTRLVIQVQSGVGFGDIIVVILIELCGLIR